MAQISTSDFRKGTKVVIEGDPYEMLIVDFVKPGKGQALYKCKMRNLIKGTLLESVPVAVEPNHLSLHLAGKYAGCPGAPLVVRPDTPPDLYVPDERVLSWLLARSVVAADWPHRTVSVAVAPTPLVCDPRLRHPGDEWPLAHPVVVALDLATDRGRGRQVVDEWDPPPAAGIRSGSRRCGCSRSS